MDKEFADQQKKLADKLSAEKAYENWTYLVPWPVDRWASESDAVDCARALRRWSDRYARWIPDEM